MLDGGTSFHFVSASPDEALKLATDAAGGLDVRLGGGPSSIRQFLAVGLVDYLHVAVVPIILGRGVNLWEGLEGLQDDYRTSSTTTPSGVTHVILDRT